MMKRKRDLHVTQLGENRQRTLHDLTKEIASLRPRLREPAEACVGFLSCEEAPTVVLVLVVVVVAAAADCGGWMS